MHLCEYNQEDTRSNRSQWCLRILNYNDKDDRVFHLLLSIRLYQHSFYHLLHSQDCMSKYMKFAYLYKLRLSDSHVHLHKNHDLNARIFANN